MWVDCAKFLTSVENVFANAIAIEEHSKRYEYEEKAPQIKSTYVLIGAYEDGDYNIPVKIDVRTFTDSTKPTARLSVLSSKIKKADIKMNKSSADTANDSFTPSTSKLHITELIRNVNENDVDLLKYIPDSLLSEKQIMGKRQGLENQRTYVNEKTREKVSIQIVIFPAWQLLLRNILVSQTMQRNLGISR